MTIDNPKLQTFIDALGDPDVFICECNDPSCTRIISDEDYDNYLLEVGDVEARNTYTSFDIYYVCHAQCPQARKEIASGKYELFYEDENILIQLKPSP